MAHNILENEINLILPQVPRKQKCVIITTLVFLYNIFYQLTAI